MSQTVAGHSALGPLWDATKNPDAASSVLVTSYKAAWWLCPRGHAFQRAPRALLRDPACPQCKVAGSSASLADKRPALAAIWHPEKNGELALGTVDATSTAPCWWRCIEGHAFQRAPLLMLRDAECPTCGLAKTSLAVTHPTIAAEWHATRNEAVTPQMVDADHIMTAWWTCSKGHDYQATVRSRAKGGSRCPTCYAGWSLEHIREFVQALLAHVGAFDPSEKFHATYNAAKGAIAGKVEFGGLDLVDGHLVLTDLALYTPEGDLVASMQRIELDIDLLAAARNDFRVSRARIVKPHLVLVQDERGLNLLRAIASKQPSSPSGPATSLTLSLEGVELVEGDASWTDGTRSHVTCEFHNGKLVKWVLERPAAPEDAQDGTAGSAAP